MDFGGHKCSMYNNHTPSHSLLLFQEALSMILMGSVCDSKGKWIIIVTFVLPGYIYQRDRSDLVKLDLEGKYENSLECTSVELSGSKGSNISDHQDSIWFGIDRKMKQ